RARHRRTGGLARWTRRIRRWRRAEHGLHAVFLGSDGAGKSTVIGLVKDDLANAFLGTVLHDFAPSILPRSAQTNPSRPHDLPPRSFPVSLLKAAWWAMVYMIGYRIVARCAGARAQLVLNHRYLVDALVDSKRYRYSGPRWLLRLL